MMETKKRKKGLWWKIPLCILLTLIVIVLIYAAYVIFSYNRIEDHQLLTVEGTAQSNTVKLQHDYTAVTYNIGFGAYTPDFTFFMDGGTQSWANSKESVIHCTEQDIALLKEHHADMILIQEADFNSTRSYYVDQKQMFIDAFPNVSSDFAVNYHSAFLFYPLYQPHGASNAGLLTMSNIQITSALRRSLPVAESFSKFIDLDRCFSVSRMKTENGKELVVFNVHTSAYGTDGDLQRQQLGRLFGDMQAEYEKGNYVICGGDFNHDFVGNSKEVFNKEVPAFYNWAAPFPDELIPQHFSKLTDYKSGLTVPSCRNCDKPYSKDCFVLTVDGFIVSDNVEAVSMDVIDTQFAYSDHNPVELTFRLK